MIKRFLATILVLVPALSALAEGPISLAGKWQFELDPGDAGLTARWYARDLQDHVNLPGALQNQGFGDDITPETRWTGAANVELYTQGAQYAEYRRPGNVKIPFSLQPDKHYVGVAWYRREIVVPPQWEAKRIVLTLERPHWETQVWLDDRLVGTNNSLATPHIYDLGTGVKPGRHTLTIRVDNRVHVDIGEWSHSVSDHTQGNWNGVVGRLELAATNPVWIDDVQVYPNFREKSARLHVTIGNRTGKAGAGTLVVNHTARPVNWGAEGGALDVEFVLPAKARAWDEFDPALQTVKVAIYSDSLLDRRNVTFGLREISTSGTQFRLNDRDVFFRGTLECCIFPLTGYPPTDVPAWKRIIRICKEHGLNHIRFHSWCPPEAAFVAADELGFYYQVECGVWTNPGEKKETGDWIYAESELIVRAYGNHPSFVLLTHGNEPHGKNREEFLAGWVNFWKARDPRRLVTSGSAYPQIPENQYHVHYPCRGPHGWLGNDYRKDVAQFNVPVIVHEMGQWCVYPNFDEIRKYTGPLKPRNFEIFHDSLERHGMLDQWRSFLLASGKLQALCYKEEIEAALRTPGIGGFQLLDLHDFPGQGTALVGVLDPFWDSKGYISPAEYRRFCNSTVPLARFKQRVFTNAETLVTEVEAAHYGPAPLRGAVTSWKVVTKGGKAMARGTFATGTLPLGNGTVLGRIEVPLSSISSPTACKLVVRIDPGGFENDWGFWVYPARVGSGDPAGVHLATSLDSTVLTELAEGRDVLFVPSGLPRRLPRLGMDPIFWNRYMFNTQGRQTLGILCDPTHPALASFPTDYFQDWQWKDIVDTARAMDLSGMPGALRPVVQVIDDWNTNRKLGLVWECRVGKGRLLVCSADLMNGLEKRPAARQLRSSLLTYMEGKRFNPVVSVTAEELTRMFEPEHASLLSRLGARVTEVDSEDPGNEAAHVVDGDPDTIWHTQWQPANAPMPHQIVIDFGRELTVRGVKYLPRQDMSNGRVRDCEIYLATDPQKFAQPAAIARWPDSGETQTLTLPQTITARFLKLIVRSEVNGNPFASIAELDVVSDEKAFRP
jgi:hypothetical protein